MDPTKIANSTNAVQASPQQGTQNEIARNRKRRPVKDTGSTSKENEAHQHISWFDKSGERKRSDMDVAAEWLSKSNHYKRWSYTGSNKKLLGEKLASYLNKSNELVRSGRECQEKVRMYNRSLALKKICFDLPLVLLLLTL